jgi:sulfur carrier protein
VRLRVNGEPLIAADGASVADVVAELTGEARGNAAPRVEARGIAVAVNGSVAPRSAWSATELADGDVVEILTAAQGG